MHTATPFKVLSLIPPMTQLNTPYPSTAYLTGFLHAQGIEAAKADLALASARSPNQTVNFISFAKK